ncbi:hypothetical protein HYPSUDRAFT_46231 [Hypholoma sublateritium FD-334 SS-4]|uniref:Uncharacterized protein n=1 Tax=Hypholoma sublateritium (strain FD-334 SS-4) TaxID=945553 RepID=A0A0D2PBB7_HYPSF|nr:hypothetical protein HYPSUDRAFT_46231 [Hypholoma sublateritium FD-334 SS-4]
MFWQITSASSSASSLIAAKSSPPPTKDYEAAFGNLSSRYGYSQCGNGVYCPPPHKSTKSTKVPSQKTTKVQFTPTNRTPAATSHPKKNYEAAFAQLSSSYGFGGAFSPAPSKK